MITKRAVKISQTYSPGGHNRKITVDGIPATEVTTDGACDVVLDLAVSERIQTLVDRALRGDDSVELRIIYCNPDQDASADRGRGYAAG